VPDGDKRAAAATNSAPRLLVISQVYVPDPAAVGQYIADAAEEMVRRGWNVKVYTASRGYDDPTAAYPSCEVRNGVAIRRLPFSSFGKGSIAVRLLAQSVFLLQAFVRALVGKRPDLILVSTSPPFAGFAGAILAAWRQVPFAWWVMDINPDQMVAAGKLATSSLAARVFDWMNRVTLGRAAAVVVLDRFMGGRLKAKLPGREAPTVIPPWPLAAGHVDPAPQLKFRSRHGLDGKCVIMYAGNHALQHPLDTLLDAARVLESDPRFVFVFVGSGAGKRAVDGRITAGATNIRSLPPVPLAELTDALLAADVHVVTMGDGMVGIVHPSKVYTAMAVGRPILFFGPDQSHIAELIAEHRVGWRISHGDTAGAVAAIREVAAVEPHYLADMGRRAAEAMSDSLSAERLRGKFLDLITASSLATKCTKNP
jgi:colanic acid biosynthesis glycosyl transferase WcaI